MISIEQGAVLCAQAGWQDVDAGSPFNPFPQAYGEDIFADLTLDSDSDGEDPMQLMQDGGPLICQVCLLQWTLRASFTRVAVRN
jgi:hypothetical protein